MHSMDITRLNIPPSSFVCSARFKIRPPSTLSKELLPNTGRFSWKSYNLTELWRSCKTYTKGMRQTSASFACPRHQTLWSSPVTTSVSAATVSNQCSRPQTSARSAGRVSVGTKW
jgi:hypothetical protein